MKKFYEMPLFEAVELATLPVMMPASIQEGEQGEGDAPARHGVGGFALKQL